MEIENYPLMSYLKINHTGYFGKSLELRAVIQEWLTYIPQSFPHYTRHTIGHSDEIILQLSKLLFVNDGPGAPVIGLSAVEAYILIAAAYLHDAGMVTSDREKQELLRSEEWISWTSEGEAATRWRTIQTLRDGNEISEKSVRDFIADVQVRFLISEFIRRMHHTRAAEVIAQYQTQLGRFAFDDPLLQKTIADICVAHGLSANELDDREKFPLQRDIRGEKVNVRLLALLLRLGDLLDMSCDRSCPLLLNAACPLPVESYAHWTQYRSITHRDTSPGKIEITAECQDAEEHRVLSDWCQWIVNEVRDASGLLARSIRHSEWSPPEASMNGECPTIVIRPHKSANYIPSNWLITLDQDAILTRLINDIYDHPGIVVRELAQNALDATRCQMYIDIMENGVEAPEFPTQIASEARNKYSIRIVLSEIDLIDPISERVHKRQVLSFEDCGVGMDTEIIKKYLLQVGRSFYTTNEFRHSYRFMPSSRFGIGFLSVFAVSDDIVIETYKPSSKDQDGPIKVKLRGPRNYLITEKGSRTRNGTRIDLVLNTPWKPGHLSALCSNWFRRVEFPILINDLGSEFKIAAEKSENFVAEIPDLTDPGASFSIKAFPLNRHGIEGEVYVFGRTDVTGEQWGQRSWVENNYVSQSPKASIPRLPSDLVCVNGIAVQNHLWRPASGLIRITHPFISVRADYRGPKIDFTLSRNQTKDASNLCTEHGEIKSRCEEIIHNHLETSPYGKNENSWKYKQGLMHEIEVGLESFWDALPGTLRVYVDGTVRFLSMNDLRAIESIRTISHYKHTYTSESDSVGKDVMDLLTEKIRRECTENVTTVTEQDIGDLSRRHAEALFESRMPTSVRMLNGEFLSIDWIRSVDRPVVELSPERIAYLTRLLNKSQVGFCVIRTCAAGDSKVLLNSENDFVKWLFLIKEAVDEQKYGLDINQWECLLKLVLDPLLYRGSKVESLSQYVQMLQALPGLPEELLLPKISLTDEQFTVLGQTRELFGLKSRRPPDRFIAPRT